jgi:type II secretion system protein N
MARSEFILEAPIPKSVLMFAMPVGGIILTSFFFLLGFPYDLLADRIAVQVESALGVRLQIGDANLRLGLLGPGFEFTDVRIGTATGDQFDLDRALVRPAWSLSWFSGDPEIVIDADSPIGNMRGSLRAGDAPRWRGEILDLEVGALPYLDDPELITLKGVINLDGDLTIHPDEVIGEVKFDMANGILGHPMLPAVIAFETLTGDIELGGENTVAFREFSLSGDGTALEISGTVGIQQLPKARALDLDVKVEKLEPGLKMILQAMGTRFSTDGPTQIHIGGTIGNPQIR